VRGEKSGSPLGGKGSGKPYFRDCQLEKRMEGRLDYRRTKEDYRGDENNGRARALKKEGGIHCQKKLRR